MARTPQDVTDKELEILQVLWERGASTIRQITEVLYPEGRTAQYATVQKLLERLEAKPLPWVTRDRSGPVHTFTARHGRDELIAQRLRSMADQLCGGSLAPLLTHLVQGQKLSAKQRQELRDLIDQLDQSGKRKGDRR
jgi:predicted transcriptional regulator